MSLANSAVSAADTVVGAPLNATVRVANAANQPIAGALVSVRFVPPPAGGPPIAVPGVLAGDGTTYTASVVASVAGSWRVEASVTTPASDLPVALTPVNVTVRANLDGTKSDDGHQSTRILTRVSVSGDS